MLRWIWFGAAGDPAPAALQEGASEIVDPVAVAARADQAGGVGTFLLVPKIVELAGDVP
ncbi:hypothetical protein [Saccharopolyspora hattusasensis]|uniref:hypothetical protein n=1 Tax=Saccharopolyspora hattusasensis TaxID=1128679 RepID=UPI003D98EAD2